MIEIRALTAETVGDYEAVDRNYVAGERFVPMLADGEWSYRFEPLDGGMQTSMPDEAEMIGVREALTDGDADVYLAYDGGACVGALAVRLWWNGCAYVTDIGVSPSHRGKGVARLLMRKACAWARRKGRRVLMLETSDINARACRFYIGQGFRLCGADTMLYGLTPSRGQTALFWYRDIDLDTDIEEEEP